MSKSIVDTSMDIYVAEEFSNVLTTVKRSNGEFSAEEFRDSILIPTLQKYEEVILVLTNVKDMSRAFIHEVFSKLHRKGYTEDDLDTKLQIISPNDKWTTQIYDSLEENSRGL